jgi:PAS domain S-box-containing protein
LLGRRIRTLVDRQRAERRNRALERGEWERKFQFFEQAVEQVGTGVAAYTDDGTVAYANGHYAALLGTTRDDLVGRHLCEFNPELDRSRFEDYWASYVLGETRVHEAVHERLDDGTRFPVETVTTAVCIQGTTYHVGTIREISDRKERERELRTFKQAIEHTGHAILITDADGVIQYVNPTFEDQTGYSRAEAVGETPALLDSGAHDDAFFADLWESITDGDVWENEVVNERKDGSHHYVDQTIAPIVDEDGDVERFVAVNTDITDLKDKEAELERQNERLEEYGRTVAHDLRNPLNVIEGRLDHIRSRGEFLPDHLDTASRQVDRMKRVIDDVLEMAKHGQAVLQPDAVRLSEVADPAWKTVEDAPASLVVAEDATILADADRLVELLSNLFRNSVEHGGSDDLTVTVGRIEDGFYVEDDGCGLDEKECNRAFESGFTTAEDGTGFGLAIVDQIATSHGWTVHASNGSDGGARFEFTDVEVIDDEFSDSEKVQSA